MPITQLTIESFRDLRSLRLEKLDRMNFIVGSGNSGKTSILEAVACLAHPLDVREWLKTARFREARENRFYPLQAVDVLRWLFPHRLSSSGEDRHDPIRIHCEGSSPIARLDATCEPHFGTRALEASADDEDDELESGVRHLVEEEGWRFELAAHMRASHADRKIEFIGWSESAASLPTSESPIMPCQLLAPYAHRNQPAQLRGMTRATIEDGRVGIVELLRDLDPNVLGVEIIASRSGGAMLALRHKSAGIAPIHVFGDGIRRALMIAMAIQRCRGGLLLLDEIEAAFHVKAMARVFPWIERACTQYDVQLLGTTHSLEAIDAVAGCIETQNVAAYHVDGPRAEVKRYSKDMLQRLVHERGLDIR